MKKVILYTAVTLFASTAYADLISLDNNSPDKCRQQLTAASAQFPVVLVFDSNDNATKEFVDNFKMLTVKFPDRNLFTLDIGSGFASVSSTHFFSQCLQQNVAVASFSNPEVFVFAKSLGNNPFVFGAIRTWVGALSMEELIKFITVNPNDTVAKKIAGGYLATNFYFNNNCSSVVHSASESKHLSRENHPTTDAHVAELKDEMAAGLATQGAEESLAFAGMTKQYPARED